MRKPILSALLSLVFALAAVAKPTLWIIGDSTVRTQTEGQQGWGDPLVAEFDPAKIEVVNRAIGGRSSRTFLTEGRWDAVRANLRPGDFVLMQFGHNDGGEKFTGNRPRATIKGVGEESETGVVEQSGEEETVHSYGWYLGKYVREAREQGATPIVVSLIPRKRFDEAGKVIRSDGDYAGWARELAEQEEAAFVPFNRLLAERYDALPREELDALFDGDDHTHTSPAGAAFNARVMAAALRELPGVDLAECLRPAALWVPRVFADHMVLQRDAPLPVWGRAEAGAEVEVAIGGTTARTVADENGAWRVELPAMAAGGPHQLTVRAGGESRTFSDVLVGEVWLCSGQSNMEFTLAPSERCPWAGSRHWQEEVAAGGLPSIRVFRAERTLRELPQPEVEGVWEVASPETVGEFPAVAWFFGRRLQRELDVPVGLVTAAYGGSTAEAWTSREKLASVDELRPLLRSYDQRMVGFRDDVEAFREYGETLAAWQTGGREGRAPRHPNPVADPHSPGVLFNGMLRPLIPYAIRGALWYQGESNVANPGRYDELQQALIEDWRGRWGRGDFPFLFVQLAPYREASAEPQESRLAETREAQAAALELPHTGMAVTLGLGDARDIHPRNKQDVADRLVRLALADVYGRDDVVARGPVLRSAEREGEQVRLRFDPLPGGLRSDGGAPRHFELAGPDKSFVRAIARLDGDSVLVFHPSIQQPTRVRYAWADNPESANLLGSDALPAAPFRTEIENP